MFNALRRVTLGAIIGALVSGCVLAPFGEPSREEVLDRVVRSAVQVIVEQQEGHRVRTGSGVVLASQRKDGHNDCFILTSGHTVSNVDGKEAFVLFGRGRGAVTKMPATVLAVRETADFDLALVQSTTAGPCRPVRTGGPPLLGDAVWVVGFPLGRHMTLASGIVSQINAEDGADPETASRLMVNASVSYGANGGGVYEARHGDLIGVVEGYSTARVSAQGANPPWYIDVPVPGQTFVTPLSDVRRFLAEVGYVHLIAPTRGRPLPSLSADAR